MIGRKLRGGMALAVLLLCAACAGEESAQQAAHRAAGTVSDLHAHLGDSIAAYREIRERQYANIAALGVGAADIEAKSDEHVAAWATAEEKDSTEIFKAVLAANSNEELVKTAPFRLIEPAPLFQTPQIDSKTMQELTTRLAVIAKKPSLTNRLATFANFVIAAGAEYKETTDPTPAAADDVTKKVMAEIAEIAEIEKTVTEIKKRQATGTITEAEKAQLSSEEARLSNKVAALSPEEVAALSSEVVARQMKHPIQSLLPAARRAPSQSASTSVQPSIRFLPNVRADPGETPQFATSGTATISEDEIADNSNVTNQLMDRLIGATPAPE